MARPIITSPGVEIRESDLSLTAPANVGTSIYVTGFAQQGPIDEVLRITTRQELVQIFGPPTNSPERYFHHTLRQLLNSPANVYAGRLPYGEGAGDGFGSKYSALAYPVTAVAGGTTATVVSTFSVTQNYGQAVIAEALSGAAIQIPNPAGGPTYITINYSINGDAPKFGANERAAADFVETITIPITFDDYTRPNTTLAQVATNTAFWFNLSAAAVVAAATGNVNASLEVDDTTGLKFYLSGGAMQSTFAGAVSASVVAGLDDPNDIFTISNNSWLSAGPPGMDSINQAGSATYVLGAPVHVDLTESQYLSAVAGAGYTWQSANTDAAKIKAETEGSTDSIRGLGYAGIVILNKAQTTINQQYEGSYIGLTDNVNVNPASNFNAISGIKTTTAAATTPELASNLTDIPAGTLTFNVTANYQTGSNNSISEVMDNLVNYDLNGRSFDDYLSIGVFKLRKSIYANEAFKLDYTLTDGQVGSINTFRKQLNPNGGSEVSMYIENKMDPSNNVSVLVNDYLSNRLSGGEALNADGTPKKKIRVLSDSLYGASESVRGWCIANTSVDDLRKATAGDGGDSGKCTYNDGSWLFPVGAYSDQTVTNKLLGNIPSKVERALDNIKNDEVYNIDVVVEGGLGTIYSVACAAKAGDYYDEFSQANKVTQAVDGLRTSSDITTVGLTLRNDYAAVFNKFEKFVKPPYDGGDRGDCIFVADPIRQILIQGKNTKILSNKNNNFQTDVYWPIKHQFENENTSYAATYGNWALVNDPYTGQNVWVPFSGFAGAAMARTDAATFPWFAPAGFSRGLVSTALDIAVNPNQKQRDEFYKANINPVAQFPNQGIVIFGQKTLQKKPSAFDRINVRRLFLALERPTKQLARHFVFEQNSEFTRTRLVNALTPVFEKARNNEGLYDYLIVCDERNNTPAVIDANELVVDIYLKPTRTAEFILVNFYATRTDANFQELVGG